MKTSVVVSKEEFRKKRYFLPEALVLAVVLGISVAAHSQDTDWQTLNQQVTQLSVGGRDAEALPLAEKALNLADKEYGAESGEKALSLNNLALIYKRQGDYEKAADLYRRSLVISERIVGPKNPSLLVTFNNLAATYEAMGLPEQADKIYQEARQRGHGEWADGMEANVKAARQSAKDKK